MATVKMTADQKKWRAENDAETMARYLEIISDSARKKAAIAAANKKADELTKRANAMKFAAGGKLSKKK